MKSKTIRDFHNELSWNTKLYTLLAITVLLVAKFTSALETDFAITMVIGLLIILFVESFTIVSLHYPRLWKYTKWGIILIFLGLLLQSMLPAMH